MEVNPGYKQTEIGMIPEDWSLRSLGDIVTFLDERRRPVRDADRASMRGTIPYYGASGIIDYVNDYLFDEDLILLGEDGENILSRNCRLAFRIAGKAWVNNHAHVLRPNSDVDIEYLSDSLESLNYEKFNSGTAQPKLTKQTCFGIPIPLPPTLSEQESIAEALSDADALIESLEQLLTKKRQIKKGAMQELLTGRKRLPGFTGKWKVKQLGEISAIAIGRTPSRSKTEFWGRGHVWLSIADLSGKVVKESKETITNLAAAEMSCVPRGTLLMSFKLSIGKLCFAGCDLFTNEAICSFTNVKVCADYLYNALSTTDFSLYGKQAVKGYTLNSESLNVVEVSLPEPPEQTAIATTLSDMDTEITALEAKLSKARQLKQGMMQELLTGRIRLL